MTDYMIKKIFSLIIILTSAYSCDKGMVKDEYISVYKMKTDYSDNVPVELSVDKTRITSAPGTINTRWPGELAQGYFLNGTMGINTAYTSITIEEYNNMDPKPGIDSLYPLIIEKDPYTDFYLRNDYDNTFNNEAGYYGFDTASINHLIRTDQLELYFTKLK